VLQLHRVKGQGRDQTIVIEIEIGPDKEGVTLILSTRVQISRIQGKAAKGIGIIVIRKILIPKVDLKARGLSRPGNKSGQ